jgi:putative transposase
MGLGRECELSFWRAYYHLVWGTFERQPLIDSEREVLIERVIRSIAQEHHALVHAVGFMPDHVHLAISIPPAVAISKVVGQMKGSSSHLINASFPTAQFKWQAEFGLYTFSEKSLTDVLDYVVNQKAKHAERQLWRQFETMHDLSQPDSSGFVG